MTETSRRGEIRRTTRETAIEARLSLDGAGSASIETGMPFLDHMLELFAHHGRFDLELRAKGDLDVDYHHSVEDAGLVLGDCLSEALGDKSGIQRFGTAYVPLDEALSRAVVDICGRPYLHYGVRFRTERVGDFPTELFEDFFRGLTDRARVTLHLDLLHGRNSHHIAETLFKAFGRALRDASARSVKGLVPSTKGTLSL
ncbi:MAG TPA: imidazoleglycerol-phosphate dehydratase HisB [Vicinamibacteria bacterium]|nr:imidazoleglycerol-phosphate dehydratase HisB [Vicinamibacteria bacterium]